MRTLAAMLCAFALVAACAPDDGLTAQVNAPDETIASDELDAAADGADLDSSAEADPAVGDHWHSAYSIVVCGELQPPLPDDSIDDRTGVHTHGDGIIHIHPFVPAATGSRATLGLFFEESEFVLTDDRLTTPLVDVDESTHDCDGDGAQIVVMKWPDLETRTPEIVTESVAEIRLDNRSPADGQLFVIAVVGASLDAEDLRELAPELRPDTDYLSNYVVVPPEPLAA